MHVQGKKALGVHAQTYTLKHKHAHINTHTHTHTNTNTHARTHTYKNTIGAANADIVAVLAVVLTPSISRAERQPLLIANTGNTI